MGKTLQNSNRKKTGFFNDAQRNAIIAGSVDKTTKSDLVGAKNGSVAIDLHALVGDFRLITDSPFFDTWKLDYQIVQDLIKLEGVLGELLRMELLSRKRIAATKENGKRLFYLKPVELQEYSDSGIRTSEVVNLLIRGLKQNEKKLIEEYVEKAGYYFPLEAAKKYTWKQVKKLLQEHLNPKLKPVDDNIRGIFQDRIKMAKYMIRQKITPEYERKIISKTGFGIRLEQYVQSVEA